MPEKYRILRSISSKGNGLGRKLSKEVIEKIKLGCKNNKPSDKCLELAIIANRKRLLERPIHNTGKTLFKKGMIPWNKGKKVLNMTGINNPRWIVDRTKLKIYGDDNLDRRSSAYNTWRKDVWLRDNFKCKINNSDCCGKINAHHILSWREYPELRYSLNNGISLCQAHHPRKRAEEKRLIPVFQELVPVSIATI